MRFSLTACFILAMFSFTACVAEPPLVNQYGTVIPALPTLEPAQVARGSQIYQERCAACHGANAQGAPNWKTPDENLNYPPPPHDDTGHTWHHPDRVLYQIIRDGLRDPLRPNQPMRMRGFGGELNDADIRALLTYFKSLWTREHRAFQHLRTTEDEIDNATPTP